LEKVGKNTLPLPAFLRACETAKLPLTGPGLVGLAVMAFQEIKAAFRERLKSHTHLAEYELTAADCHFVRENFSYQKFNEFTFPSGDLQLAAKSQDAILRGEYRWIVSELHPAAATLHHCMYWSCPDHSALSRALQLSTSGKPFFHFGFFAADFTAHTTVRIFDALPQQAVFASVPIANISDLLPAIGSFRLGFIRSNSGWRRIHRDSVAGVSLSNAAAGRFPVRKWAMGISPAFRVNWFSPSKDCAPPKIGPGLFTFARRNRRCDAVVRKAATKIPNRFSSISRVIFFSKFFVAG